MRSTIQRIKELIARGTWLYIEEPAARRAISRPTGKEEDKKKRNCTKSE